MALHDAYARLTPFELAFPDDGEHLISAVREELGEDGDPGDVRTFLTLSAVGAFLEETRAEDTGVEAVHPFGMLAYHAFHFLRAGRPVLLLAEGLARRLVKTGGDGAEPRLPAEAGYVQLPQHLFWMPGGQGVPESIDGFFWTRSRDGLLHLLLAMGMRRDRAGLGVAPVPDAPWSEAAAWTGARIRREGDDFSSALPGAEIEELYSFEVAGEVLKLMARLAAYLHERPAAAVQRTPADAPPDGPPASRLPYQKIVLVDPEERRHDG